MRTIKPGLRSGHLCGSWVGVRWICPHCTSLNEITDDDFIPGQDCRAYPFLVGECPTCRCASRITQGGKAT